MMQASQVPPDKNSELIAGPIQLQDILNEVASIEQRYRVNE